MVFLFGFFIEFILQFLSIRSLSTILRYIYVYDLTFDFFVSKFFAWNSRKIFLLKTSVFLIKSFLLKEHMVGNIRILQKEVTIKICTQQIQLKIVK